MTKVLIFILATFAFFACDEEAPRSDAYGNFEATNTLISSEANGRLLFLHIEEGQTLAAGTLVGLVDTTQLHLQRKQIEAKIGTLPKKLQNSLAEIEVLKRQQANLIRERDRAKRLLEKKAATAKQLDDLNGEILVLDQRVEAVESQTATANRSILAEKGPLLAQIEVVKEQIRKSYIYNPLTGKVITKLAEQDEIAGVGTPLYRIADLDTMSLRFYAGSVQLQNIALGQDIEVLIDQGMDDYQKHKGQISWIAEQAEFTPKTIQTKEDRVNLVYAIKAKVANPNGYLKIGMPAEVNFGHTAENVEE